MTIEEIKQISLKRLEEKGFGDLEAKTLDELEELDKEE